MGACLGIVSGADAILGVTLLTGGASAAITTDKKWRQQLRNKLNQSKQKNHGTSIDWGPGNRVQRSMGESDKKAWKSFEEETDSHASNARQRDTSAAKYGNNSTSNHQGQGVKVYHAWQDRIGAFVPPPTTRGRTDSRSRRVHPDNNDGYKPTKMVCREVVLRKVETDWQTTEFDRTGLLLRDAESEPDEEKINEELVSLIL